MLRVKRSYAAGFTATLSDRSRGEKNKIAYCLLPIPEHFVPQSNNYGNIERS
jgi:hypothetical protein